MAMSIVQENSFGREITLTRSEFIDRWTSHVKQVYLLGYDDDWRATCDDFMHALERKASAEFDKIYDQQHKRPE